VRPQIEGLETRLALSVSSALVSGQLLVTGDNSGNTITLDHSGTSTIVNGKAFADALITGGIRVDSGTGNDVVNILASEKPTTINGQGGADTVNVGKNGNARLVHGSLIVGNANGFTTLNVNDQADGFGRNVSLTAGAGSTQAALIGLAGAQISFALANVSGLSLGGGSGGNTFTVDTPGLNSTEVFIKTGIKNDTVNVLRTGDSELDIDGQSGIDTVNIGSNGSTQGIAGFVIIHNAAGQTDLNVNDSLDNTPHNVNLFSFIQSRVDGLGGEIEYDPNAVRTLTVSAGGGGNHFTVSDTGGTSTSVILNTGNGADTVNVQRTTGALTINGQNGLDTVNVGNAGSVQQIAGAVTVTNVFNFTALTVDDSADTKPKSVLMDVGSDNVALITGLAPAPIRYRSGDVSSVVVSAGSGGNSFNVLNTAQNFRLPLTTLNTGIGNDTVNVTRSAGALTINGQNGRDNVNIFVPNSSPSINGTLTVTNVDSFTALNVDASAVNTPETATLDVVGGDGVISGLTPGTIHYHTNDVSSVQVTGGSGGNNFTVANTAANPFLSVNTVLNSGTGSDTVNVRGTTGSLSINGQSGNDLVDVHGGNGSAIHGPLGVSNSAGHTALVVDDSLDTTARLVQVNSNSIVGPGTIQIELFDPGRFSSVTIFGGSGGNGFFVHSTQAGVPVTIDTGDGSDQINVGSPNNTLDAIQGPLTINGQGGFDTLNINDQGSTTPHVYNQTATTVSRSGAATITFSSIESLNVNKGPIAGSASQASNLTLTGVIQAGGLATLSGRLVDANAGATLSLTVDWGDGSKPQQSTPDRAPFSLMHLYPQAGRYTVRVIWTDSTGQSNSRDLTLTVN
jgi:hypothetical protein